MSVRAVTFEVVPAGWTPGDRYAFEPFLMDVPALDTDDENRPARRAYWSAFTMLGRQGFEPEEFDVFEYHTTAGRGRKVGPGGYLASPEGAAA